ncbi:MAG: anti-virulence regulator CigR family protein [Limibacillus sp.]
MLTKTFRAKMALAGAFGLAFSLAMTPPLAEAGNHSNKAKGNKQEQEWLYGQNQGQGNSGNSGNSDEELIQRGAEVLTEAFLTDSERRIIRESFSGGYPEGFQKPKPIPPGIQKKLARGGTMPPGIAKTRMPDSVLSRLPRREGQEILFIDDDVYLIQKSTELILDVLENVL